MSALHLVVEGKSLPLPSHVSKAGNTFYALTDTRKDGSTFVAPYGVKKPALGTNLPTTVEVSDGATSTLVYLTLSVTDDGRNKASYRGAHTLEGHEVNLRVSISVTKDGCWNISAKGIPFGGGGHGRQATAW